jgi:hypothetical protein
VQHVATVVASRLGYRRRVVDVIRARGIGMLVVALLVSAAAGACGSSRQASGFCGRVERGDPAFNSDDAAHLRTALAAFDKIAATAPPAVASDLHVISSFRRRLAEDPQSIKADPALVTAFVASGKRVDSYLHDTCGVDIPPPSKLFSAPG